MKVWRAWPVAALVVLTLAGCKNGPDTVKPLKPSRRVPAAAVRMEFTRKVTGPVDLMVDGVRLPVEQPAKAKTFRALVITGLAPGKHTYFISSQRDAFGPDRGEMEVKSAEGTFLVLFSQHFASVLYGKTEPLPPSEGLPGVKAALEK